MDTLVRTEEATEEVSPGALEFSVEDAFLAFLLGVKLRRCRQQKNSMASTLIGLRHLHSRAEKRKGGTPVASKA